MDDLPPVCSETYVEFYWPRLSSAVIDFLSSCSGGSKAHYSIDVYRLVYHLCSSRYTTCLLDDLRCLVTQTLSRQRAEFLALLHFQELSEDECISRLAELSSLYIKAVPQICAVFLYLDRTALHMTLSRILLDLLHNEFFSHPPIFHVLKHCVSSLRGPPFPFGSRELLSTLQLCSHSYDHLFPHSFLAAASLHAPPVALQLALVPFTGYLPGESSSRKRPLEIEEDVRVDSTMI
eukprot:gnl/Spiro4/29605_TR14514_c0_g1_i1.p1 gnl/Spiro4/29605_TR14514_c0_g1~~gnl/Spiro4/29605_TR14514_c0_g1_i1.p1  ORF type:complete len:235 (+),score=20.51 gnl/Spiro4/29605_TR14514_c0_g1_i1:1-705(+)